MRNVDNSSARLWMLFMTVCVTVRLSTNGWLSTNHTTINKATALGRGCGVATMSAQYASPLTTSFLAGYNLRFDMMVHFCGNDITIY